MVLSRYWGGHHGEQEPEKPVPDRLRQMADHPEIEHLNIDKIQYLHDQTIIKVLEIMKKKPTVTAKG